MRSASKQLRAQSAMEYLMTYGWAILVIAVVLAALFGLNIFSSGTLAGSSCVSTTGYLCKSMAITVSGTSDVLAFYFGQNTGSALYNVGFGCSAGSTSTGLPNPTSATTLYDTGLGSLGAPSTQNASPTGNIGKLSSGSTYNTLRIQTGGTVQITGITCYDSTGAPLTSTSAPIGTSFTGTLWINYTPTPFGLSADAYNGFGGSFQNVPAGNWLTAKVATIVTKIQ